MKWIENLSHARWTSGGRIRKQLSGQLAEYSARTVLCDSAGRKSVHVSDAPGINIPAPGGDPEPPIPEEEATLFRVGSSRKNIPTIFYFYYRFP